jgi:alpha-ribazole phosphatase
MDLYLIRHTLPGVPPGVCYGQADVDVAESFESEAAAVLAKLDGIVPAACYSSPLRRCAKLAAALTTGEVRHDPRLMELSFGSWEMRRWEDIPRPALDRWGQAFVEEAPPGGESLRALHGRVQGFLRDARACSHDGPVLAITHAGVIRVLLAEALGLPLEAVFRFHLDYGGVTRLHFQSALPTVEYVNR